MPKKMMWVEWEDGAELSRSQKRPGHYSPLTRDGGNELGQVTLSDVDEEEDSAAGWAPGFDVYPTDEEAWEADQDSALVGIIAMVLAAMVAKPHVERWWKNQALPVIKSTKESTRDKFAKARKAGRRARDPDVVPFVDAETADSSKELDAAPEEEKARMSRDEAQQRLIAALVARAFSDEQVRVLLNARIEDADGFLGLKSSMEQLTPGEVEGHINLMLESNPALLDEFVKLFRGERIGEGASLPPSSEGHQEALRLTVRE